MSQREGGARRRTREVYFFPLPLVPCVHIVIKLYPWLVQILFPFFFRKYYCLMMSLKNELIFYYINVSKYCFTVFIRLNTYLAFGEIESQFSELCRLQSCTEIFFIILE